MSKSSYHIRSKAQNRSLKALFYPRKCEDLNLRLWEKKGCRGEAPAKKHRPATGGPKVVPKPHNFLKSCT